MGIAAIALRPRDEGLTFNRQPTDDGRRRAKWRSGLGEFALGTITGPSMQDAGPPFTKILAETAKWRLTC